MGDGTSIPSQRQGRFRRSPEVTARVGTNLRRARLAAGFTQTQLGNRLDEWTDGNSISRWERGINRPLDRTLERLAEILDVEFAWFFADNGPEPQESEATAA